MVQQQPVPARGPTAGRGKCKIAQASKDPALRANRPFTLQDLFDFTHEKGPHDRRSCGFWPLLKWLASGLKDSSVRLRLRQEMDALSDKYG
jgi:hypothetical protein